MDTQFYTFTLPLFFIVKSYSLFILRCNPASKMHYLKYSSFAYIKCLKVRTDKISSAIITEL